LDRRSTVGAFTLQQRLTGTDRLHVSGKHRFIADYLVEDVLAPLPEEIRRFLFQTSVLDRLCGPLCDAVTGREDGQEMLETLERDNLFLVPLDDSREWFRYHRLFADFLHQGLNRSHPDEVADLHCRAARWYLAQDLPEQAFHHAVDGDDIELVIQILERYFPVKLLSGEIRVLERWLDSLPEEWHSGYPMIGFVRAGILLFTGQFDACARCLDKVEQTLVPPESEDMRRQRARLTALRCYIACFQNDLVRAETLADQALRRLPEADLGFRPGVYGALGDTYRRNGRWQEAKECYLKLLDFSHAPVFRVEAVHVFGALADLDLRQGHLREAAANWSKALAAIQAQENWGLFPLPVIGWVYMRTGEILYEWNALAESWDHLSRGLERAELGGDVRAMIAGYLLAGRLKLTEGDTETAAAYLEQARPLVESAQFSHWTSRFERFQLELWLVQNRLRSAVDWADKMLRSGALEGRPESETTQLTMARVLIVKGDATSIERVLIRLERLLQVAVEEGRTGVKVDCLSRQGNRFVVTAGDLRYEAENVVVAMANYQSPRLPPFAQELDPGIIQLHSSEYLNPSQLQNGGVLIVGAGNSGSEIALEVAHGHPTWISGRDTGQMPFRIEGFAARYLLILLVLRFLFHNVLTVNTPIGRKVRPKVLSQGGPLIRVQSKDLATAGIVRVPRTVSVRDGRPVLEDGRVLHVAM
jgi:ATP/maltotriose-dependent transcriptional regulator MalT